MYEASRDSDKHAAMNNPTEDKNRADRKRIPNEVTVGKGKTSKGEEKNKFTNEMDDKPGEDTVMLEDSGDGEENNKKNQKVNIRGKGKKMRNKRKQKRREEKQNKGLEPLSEAQKGGSSQMQG